MPDPRARLRETLILWIGGLIGIAVILAASLTWSPLP